MFTQVCPFLGNVTAERHFPRTETLICLSDQGTPWDGSDSLSWKVNSPALALIS